jgi:AcrR family transcriptional regulator
MKQDSGAAVAAPPPRRQRRGIERLEALLAAGRHMLNERSLEELSVSDLCREVDATTGSFYNQFDSKAAFFQALQHGVCAQRKREFETFMQEVEAQRLAPAEMVARLVRNFVEHMRQDGGVIRASLLHVRTGEDWWAAFRDLGAHHKRLLNAWLLPRLGHIKASQRQQRIAFAHQALSGTIVHTLLNRPGVLGLQDEAFIREVVRMVQNYLELPTRG